MKKIFQIGFNKCGTRSIHEFLTNNDIASLHWDNNKLARKIQENFLKKLPLLTGYEDVYGFTDMEVTSREEMIDISVDYFKELYKEYPDAIYILNTRNVDDWILSRLKHGNGNYLKCYMEYYSEGREDVIERWKSTYHTHIQQVQSFFENHKEANYIHLDLDNDSSSKLGDFLTENGFELKNKNIPHSHKTIDKEVNALRDAAIFYEKYDIAVSLTLMSKANELRPNGPVITKKIVEYKKNLSKSRNFFERIFKIVNFRMKR